MPGTKAGGVKAAKTNRKLYGKDFYKGIGTLGGKKSRGGGFAKNHELARAAGAKGGRLSRRGKAGRSKEEIAELDKEIQRVRGFRNDTDY